MEVGRRILIVFLLFALGLMIPALVGIKGGRAYRATAKVRVQVPSEPRAAESFMRNEVELAGSYAVMERVAYRLGYIGADELLLPHEFGFTGETAGGKRAKPRSPDQVKEIVNAVRAQIDIENPSGTNLLLIRARGKNGSDAMSLAEIAAQEYIKERAYLMRENIEEGIKFISSELKAKEAELEKAKESISRYLKRHPDFTPSSSARSISGAIAQYNRKLEELNLEIKGRRRELEVIRSLIKPIKITPQYIARISSFSMSIVANPVISALIEEIKGLQAERRKLLRHYTEIHPKVKENKARIEELSSKLGEEIKSKLQADMERISAEIARLEKERDVTQKRLNGAKNRMSRLSRLQGEYALIESTARSLSELCSMLRGKLEEYRLKAIEKPKIAALIGLPGKPPSPDRIGRLRRMAIGGLIGLVVGLLLAFRPKLPVRTGRERITPPTPKLHSPILIVPDLEWDELIISDPSEARSVKVVHALTPRGVSLVGGYSPDGRRTSLGFNLAIYSARKGLRTILVGCVPGDERLSRLFGIEEMPGLRDVVSSPDLLPKAIRTATDMLFGMIEVEALANVHGIDYLNLLPYGNPDEELSPEELGRVISDLRRWYRMIVLDCSSMSSKRIGEITSLADTLLIACHVTDLNSDGLASFVEDIGEDGSRMIVVATR